MMHSHKYSPALIYLLMTFILALIIFLVSGCKTVNDAPISTLYVIDIQHNVCSMRKITNKNTLSSVWIEDLPLYSCDGVVGLNIQEYLNLRTYMRSKE